MKTESARIRPGRPERFRGHYDRRWFARPFLASAVDLERLGQTALKFPRTRKARAR